MKNLTLIALFLFFGLTHAQFNEQNRMIADLALGNKSSFSLGAEYAISNSISLGGFFLNTMLYPSPPIRSQKFRTILLEQREIFT